MVNIPYLNHAGVEAVGLLDERDDSQVVQDPLVLENGIQAHPGYSLARPRLLSIPLSDLPRSGIEDSCLATRGLSL